MRNKSGPKSGMFTRSRPRHCSTAVTGESVRKCQGTPRRPPRDTSNQATSNRPVRAVDTITASLIFFLLIDNCFLSSRKRLLPPQQLRPERSRIEPNTPTSADWRPKQFPRSYSWSNQTPGTSSRWQLPTLQPRAHRPLSIPARPTALRKRIYAASGAAR